METKELILKKALDMFAKSGYDSVSIRDIAKAVNIKESSIERKTAFLEKEKFISEEFKKRSEIRKNKLGFEIEPI